MTETSEIVLEKKPRLKFIDMARSLAIILMLEGHFIDDSLIESFRDLDNPIYSTWRFIRGFTAPVFLTVTGLVFVYLLLGNRHIRYFSNIRVKKGFKRVLELLFWGYLLQYYAFHVLQCIGIGILFILLIFGLYQLIKVIPLWIYFFILGTLLFLSQIYLSTLPDEQYIPANASPVIQNIFRGEHSIFPIIPWMGYTMYGAMIGSILFDLQKHVKKWSFAFSFIAIGLFLFHFFKIIVYEFDQWLQNKTYFLYKVDWIYERLGMVFIVLGILMIVEKLLGDIKQNWFMKMGQNTLTIFILHFVLLYGSLTRMGLTKLFHQKLGPWEVTIGAILFIAFFAVLVQSLDWIKYQLRFLLKPIQQFMNSIFGID